MNKLTHRSFANVLTAFLVLTLCLGFFNSNELNAQSSVLEGVALKDQTHVYESTSKDSSSLKSYAQGSILLYQYHSSGWYKALVYVNGEAKTGYIHANDVETATDDRQTVQGIALKDKTNVYSRASRNSYSPRSYDQGQILYYETYTSNWYKAFIYLNGQKENVYIHGNDVETIVKDQETLQGVALKDRTHIYSLASKKSSTLKSYDQGSVLWYKTLSSEWYEALVYIGGKARTGYIHRDDVDNLVASQKTVNGIARQTTHVYSKASQSSEKLRSYSTGTSLIYKTFSSEWYEALVFINGKATTGYIHVSAVDTKLDEQTSLKGIGLKNPTNIYSNLSRNSQVLRSYSEGTVLMYKTLSENWNEAIIFVDGKKQIGYIHVDDVENAYTSQEKLQGKAKNSVVYVYSRASKNSSTLRYYNQTPVINLSTFSKNWYEVNVNIDGKDRTGYIHVDDMNVNSKIEETTSYDKNFDDLVDIWYSKSPQIWKDGGFVPATKSEVALYANPNNFSDRDAKSFFQYLVLSQPTGVSPTEVNQKILYNKGSLKGTGSAFYQAGKVHSVNELYLIAHALHETGNGGSTLARGVGVDKNGNVPTEIDKDGNEVVLVIRDLNDPRIDHIVYNMYGYGARDACPVKCGAEYAFDQGWLTPEDAVIGGAKFIASGYIHEGQDTLYKMRWNPESPGDHQYATDVNWAIAQTHTIANLYGLIDNYTLFFDIPEYNATPAGGLVLEYPNNTIGITTDRVNFRDKSTTSKSTVFETLDTNTRVDILGYTSGQTVDGNDIWYKIKYNGNEGYIHSDYAEFSNLLQVVDVDPYKLRVRSEPSTDTDDNVIDSLAEGTYVAAVIDSNGNFVRDGAWYKIYIPSTNNTGWVHGDYINEIK